MVLIYYGIDAANGAIAAIIVGLEPVLIALWAALLLDERFGGRRAAGLAVGLAGSLLVAGLGPQAAPEPGRRRCCCSAPGWRSPGTRWPASRHLTRHGAARADRR